MVKSGLESCPSGKTLFDWELVRPQTLTQQGLKKVKKLVFFCVFLPPRVNASTAAAGDINQHLGAPLGLIILLQRWRKSSRKNICNCLLQPVQFSS